MSKLNSRLSQLLVGLLSLLIVGALLLGLYCYLDLKRLNQQTAYPTPEEAFLGDQSSAKVEIEGSRRCSFIAAGQKVFPLDDLWFVTGHYTRNGERKPAGALFFRVEDGWVRVSETSPTPILVCAAKKVRQEFGLLIASQSGSRLQESTLVRSAPWRDLKSGAGYFAPALK